MKSVFYLFIFFSGSLTLAAQTNPDSIPIRLDKMMQEYVNQKYFSGVVLLAKKDKITYEKAFGLADKEHNISNTVNTNFNIASAGKTFTATMIMQLVQEGKVNLEDSLVKYLPEYKIKNADKIKICHLLTHTSGINNYMMHPNFLSKKDALQSLDQVMPLVSDMPLTFDEPGKKFDYSNSGFIVLGKIIEKVTAKSYVQNLQERIFTKTGIHNSYIHHPATFNAPAEAIPYYTISSKTWRNGKSDEYPAFSDGGMQSNVEDLYKFSLGLLEGKLLRKDLRDEMWKGRMGMGRGGKYAYGWIENENSYGIHVVSHDGGGHAFSSDIKIAVEDGYIIIVLINNRLNPREISNNILKLVYTGKYEQPKKYLENIVFEKIEDEGWRKVNQEFNSILKENGLDKVPDVWLYLRLMDLLGETKDSSLVREVYQKAVNEFPGESGPHDVMGNILLDWNKKEEAGIYFNKALAINPNDDFAKMMLARIRKEK